MRDKMNMVRTLAAFGLAAALLGACDNAGIRNNPEKIFRPVPINPGPGPGPTPTPGDDGGSPVNPEPEPVPEPEPAPPPPALQAKFGLYISNSGNDGNSGTRDAPLKTFAAALNQIETRYDGEQAEWDNDTDFAEIIVLDNVNVTSLTINGTGGIYPAILIIGDTETDSAPPSTVTNTDSGNLLTITGGAKVRLGNKLTLDADGKGRVVEVSSATLVMETGATVTGGYVSGDTSGGGVYVDTSGTFTMEGGTIQENTATYIGGGGVYVSSSSTFTMEGGTIAENTANNGGGVFVVNSSTFTMEGGTIAENTASSGGGGVYANGTFTMEGGTIAENTAYGGGGVYVSSSGTFSMSGDSTIQGNTASAYGGGVGVSSSSTFTMSGGTIQGNTATNYGGGVYVHNSGTFTMSGGTIAENTATTSGGGGVYASGTFTMSGGTIAKNTATTSGGGVYVGGGSTFTMSGGAIAENTATTSGGGVYVGGGSTFTMSGGAIAENTATTSGGGVYVPSGGTFTKDGGAIYGVKKTAASDSADEDTNLANISTSPGTSAAGGAPTNVVRDYTAGPADKYNKTQGWYQ
jgi:parallel beta-helix repeat protein/predicted outer membrane repeat protein